MIHIPSPDTQIYQHLFPTIIYFIDIIFEIKIAKGTQIIDLYILLN